MAYTQWPPAVGLKVLVDQQCDEEYGKSGQWQRGTVLQVSEDLSEAVVEYEELMDTNMQYKLVETTSLDKLKPWPTHLQIKGNWGTQNGLQLEIGSRVLCYDVQSTGWWSGFVCQLLQEEVWVYFKEYQEIFQIWKEDAWRICYDFDWKSHSKELQVKKKDPRQLQTNRYKQTLENFEYEESIVDGNDGSVRRTKRKIRPKQQFHPSISAASIGNVNILHHAVQHNNPNNSRGYLNERPLNNEEKEVFNNLVQEIGAFPLIEFKQIYPDLALSKIKQYWYSYLPTYKKKNMDQSAQDEIKARCQIVRKSSDVLKAIEEYGGYNRQHLLNKFPKVKHMSLFCAVQHLVDNGAIQIQGNSSTSNDPTNQGHRTSIYTSPVLNNADNMQDVNARNAGNAGNAGVDEGVVAWGAGMLQNMQEQGQNVVHVAVQDNQITGNQGEQEQEDQYPNRGIGKPLVQLSQQPQTSNFGTVVRVTENNFDPNDFQIINCRRQNRTVSVNNFNTDINNNNRQNGIVIYNNNINNFDEAPATATAVNGNNIEISNKNNNNNSNNVNNIVGQQSNQNNMYGTVICINQKLPGNNTQKSTQHNDLDVVNTSQKNIIYNNSNNQNTLSLPSQFQINNNQNNSSQVLDEGNYLLSVEYPQNILPQKNIEQNLENNYNKKQQIQVQQQSSQQIVGDFSMGRGSIGEVSISSLSQDSTCEQQILISVVDEMVQKLQNDDLINQKNQFAEQIVYSGENMEVDEQVLNNQLQNLGKNLANQGFLENSFNSIDQQNNGQVNSEASLQLQQNYTNAQQVINNTEQAVQENFNYKNSSDQQNQNKQQNILNKTVAEQFQVLSRPILNNQQQSQVVNGTETDKDLQNNDQYTIVNQQQFLTSSSQENIINNNTSDYNNNNNNNDDEEEEIVVLDTVEKIKKSVQENANEFENLNSDDRATCQLPITPIGITNISSIVPNTTVTTGYNASVQTYFNASLPIYQSNNTICTDTMQNTELQRDQNLQGQIQVENLQQQLVQTECNNNNNNLSTSNELNCNGTIQATIIPPVSKVIPKVSITTGEPNYPENLNNNVNFNIQQTERVQQIFIDDQLKKQLQCENTGNADHQIDKNNINSINNNNNLSEINRQQNVSTDNSQGQQGCDAAQSQENLGVGDENDKQVVQNLEGDILDGVLEDKCIVSKEQQDRPQSVFLECTTNADKQILTANQQGIQTAVAVVGEASGAVMVGNKRPHEDISRDSCVDGFDGLMDRIEFISKKFKGLHNDAKRVLMEFSDISDIAKRLEAIHHKSCK